MLDSTHRHGATELNTGTQVAVRNRFDGSWADGFEIVDRDTGGRGSFKVRRRSDESVLPARFGADDVREAASSSAAAWDAGVPTAPAP